MSKKVTELVLKGNPKLSLSLEEILRQRQTDSLHFRLEIKSSDPKTRLEIVNWPKNIISKWRSEKVANLYYKPFERLINIHLGNIRSGGIFLQPGNEGQNRILMEFTVDSAFTVSDENKNVYLIEIGKLFK